MTWTPGVLSFRNQHLVTQLLADKREKIYATYGAARLPGVMEMIKREPGWTVESVKWMRTIAAPEHLEGIEPSFGTKRGTKTKR